MSYAELRDGIKAAPKTYLPALLEEIVVRCEKERVFVAGGLARTVESIIKYQIKPEDEKENNERTRNRV